MVTGNFLHGKKSRRALAHHDGYFYKSQWRIHTYIYIPRERRDFSFGSLAPSSGQLSFEFLSARVDFRRRGLRLLDRRPDATGYTVIDSLSRAVFARIIPIAKDDFIRARRFAGCAFASACFGGTVRETARHRRRERVERISRLYRIAD